MKDVTLIALRGPITDAIAYADPINPVIAGLPFGGAHTPMIMYDPPKVPATPNPVIALPTIRVVLFCATPTPY